MKKILLVAIAVGGAVFAKKKIDQGRNGRGGGQFWEAVGRNTARPAPDSPGAGETIPSRSGATPPIRCETSFSDDVADPPARSTYG